MKTQWPLFVTIGPVLAALSLQPTFAADPPEAGTNTIHGIIQFINADAGILARLGPPGEEGMTNVSFFAYTDPPDVIQTTKVLYGPDRVINPYSMTVAVGDVPLVYNVFAVIGLDNDRESYWTTTQPSSPLTRLSPSATVNFDECVALVELRYQRMDGSPVAALDGRATINETATPYLLRGQCFSQAAGSTGNFLAVPSGVEFLLTVEVETGTDIYSDRITHIESHILTLACDDTPVIIITIPEAGTLGSIAGNFNMTGQTEPATEGYLELLARPVIKARGPTGNQRYAAIDGEAPAADLVRAFTLGGLVPSTPTEAWRVQAEMQFGTGYRFEYFLTPALGYGMNPGVEVNAGATTSLGDKFVMTPSKITGQINLTGPLEFGGNISALRGVYRAADYDLDMDGIPDGIGASGIGGSYVIGTGVDELAPGATLSAAGGSATASFEGAFNPVTSAFEGDYEVVLGTIDNQPGVWKHDGLNLAIYTGTNAGPYVNEAIYVVEDQPWQGVLGPGDVATQDLNYGFAELCYRIRSPALFYNPRVTGSVGKGTNYDAGGNVINSYRVIISGAYGLPDLAANATSDALVKLYLPAGTYTLSPAITILDPEGGESLTQLPSVEVSLVAGERRTIEGCVNVTITPPVCTMNTGFIAWADATSCEATLTNLSMTITPLSDPGIRLGYSDIRILDGTGRTTLRIPGQVFPEFDGYTDHPEYYSNMLYTAVAKDNKGGVVTSQIIGHYDFTPPTINCPGDITVISTDGAGMMVEFTATATDNRPEPLRSFSCVPASGSVFPVGTTTVTCTASDLCRNTNTCTFNITVQPPTCVLTIELLVAGPPEVRLTWDCAGTLECAPAVDGPWEDLPAATSPHAMPVASGNKFFRIRRSP